MKFLKKLLKELNSVNSLAQSTKSTLERQFLNEVRLRKEVNSEHIWASYYIPKAARRIVEENGTLTKQDTFKMECLANSMMFEDMAYNKLDEFYRFKDCEV